MMESDSILNRIEKENVKCAAFDLFDTLIERLVNPEYVKRIWAKQICVKLAPEQNHDQIYQARRRLEMELCAQNARNGYDSEFRYGELIKKLFEVIRPKCPLSEFLTICKETELLTEYRVQRRCDGVYETLEELKKRGIRCIIISDFYLPASDIKRILAHHGIDTYFDRIYVSCDELLSKRSGRLYEAVLSKEVFTAGQLVMIGDNAVSDRDNAVSHGFNALWIDRTDIHERYKELWKEETAPGRVRHYIRSLRRLSEKGYFQELAYSLYAFTQLLHERLIRDRRTDVFFLSREGEFLKKVFDAYQEINRFTGSEHVKTYYLIVSRKSTFIPSLKPLDEEDFFVLFRQYKEISLFDFLSSLSFESGYIKRISQELQVDETEKQQDFPTSNLFSRLKGLPSFQDEYERIRIAQNRSFLGYLHQFGVDYRKNGLSIVDVGWKGSIQDNLFRILGEQAEIDGYYLGLVAPGNRSQRNRKTGVLFQNCDGMMTDNYPVYSANCSIFEMLLAASHGSANGYAEREGRIEALTYLDREEEELYRTVVKGMQEQMFVHIKALMQQTAFSDTAYADYATTVTRMHARMVLFPTKKEIEFFRGMQHYENFGVFQYTRFERKPESFSRSVKNLIKFIHSPQSILGSGFWAPLTLEDAGLSWLKFPYSVYKMCRFEAMTKGGRK